MSKKKRDKKSETVDKPPEIYNYKGLKFSSQKEAGIAKFIFENNIETNPEEMVKLTALVYENKILHDNKSEIRFARLLMKNGIRFEYSKKIKTKRIVRDRNYPESPDTTANNNNVKTEPNSREIDFWLPDGPILVPLCAQKVQAFEIKGGKLSMDSHRQQREIKDAGKYTFIVLPEYLAVWEEYGLLEPISIRNKSHRGLYQKPICLIKNQIPKNESGTKNDLMKVLLRSNVGFEYVEDDRNCSPGKPCHRSIFFLKKPTKGFWCGNMTQAIILVEGKITLDDIERWEEVSETFCTFLAIWNFVQFWNRYGFLRQKIQ